MEKKLKALINKNYSTWKIAEELKIGQTTVRYQLKKYGLKTHPILLKPTKECEACGKVINKRNIRFCSNSCQRLLEKKEIDIMIQEGKIVTPKTLKDGILRLRERKCEICNRKTWNNKPVPLVLDHVNGNSENNFPSNLRLICNNCDAQLPTFSGRNHGFGRKKRRLQRQKRLNASMA